VITEGVRTTYLPAALSEAMALNVSNYPTNYTLSSADANYWFDMSGRSDMGGVTYEVRTTPMDLSSIGGSSSTLTASVLTLRYMIRKGNCARSISSRTLRCKGRTMSAEAQAGT
jgi:hypothetical protein